jgi:hypothetical protein
MPVPIEIGELIPPEGVNFNTPPSARYMFPLLSAAIPPGGFIPGSCLELCTQLNGVDPLKWAVWAGAMLAAPQSSTARKAHSTANQFCFG